MPANFLTQRRKEQTQMFILAFWWAFLSFSEGFFDKLVRKPLYYANAVPHLIGALLF